MMKPIDGFKTEPRAAAYPMLPKGLYIAKIQGAQVEGSEPDQRLVIRLDICEGEYTGYYTKRYHNDRDAGGRFEVRYKGDYKIQIPDARNTKRQHPEWDEKRLRGDIWAIEQSNDGYHWDWNEAGLKGKFVGINVRQGSFNGSPYTTIGRLESVPEIRAGKVKLMPDMAPRNSDSSGSGTSQAAMSTSEEMPGFTIVDEEIPF